MIKEQFTYSDGETSLASIFASNKDEPLCIVIPAMGAKAKYYESFCSQLNAEGFNVISVDWRGIGDSSIRASRASDFGYRNLIQDLKEVVEFGQQKFPNSTVTLIGHSLGGQIASLYTSKYSDDVDDLILITACNVYYKGWDNQTQVILAGKVFPVIAKLFGYFPGNKIGFSGREAMTVMQDWSSNALTGNYQLTGSSFNYDEALQKLEKKILTFSVQNDRLASLKAIDNLLGKFHENSTITKCHLTDENTQIEQLNHFNWAKKSDYLVSKIVSWKSQ